MAASTPSYQRPDFAENMSVHFNTQEEWKLSLRRITPRTECIHLGPRFNLTREHIQALIIRTTRLKVLQIDYTGTILNDEDVESIVSHNRKLGEVILNKALNVSDRGLIHILKKCPKIVIIKNTGIDGWGHIFGNFAGFMNGKHIISSRLRLEALYLEDQPTNPLVLRSISRKWRGLLILTGCTMGPKVKAGTEFHDRPIELWHGSSFHSTNIEKTLTDMGYRMPKVEEDNMRFLKQPEKLNIQLGTKRPRSDSNASISNKRPAIMSTEDTAPLPDVGWLNCGCSESESVKDDREGGEDDDNEDEDLSEDSDDKEADWSDEAESLFGYDPANPDEDDKEYYLGVQAGCITPPVYDLYESEEIPLSEKLCYKRTSNWETRWPGDLKRTGIRMIEFSEGIHITDTQTKAIATASSKFRKTLHIIECEKGAISDNAVAKLARAVPSLRDVVFSDAKALTDAAIISIVRNCPYIERIQISGNERLTESVTCRDLVDALQDPTVAKKLRQLELWNQILHIQGVKTISRTRQDMAIVKGETVGDSIEAQRIAEQTSAGHVYVYVGGSPWKEQTLDMKIPNLKTSNMKTMGGDWQSTT